MLTAKRKTIVSFILFISVLHIIPARADEVNKDFWVDAMKTELPNTLCDSMEFFRQCFEVNEVQCVEAASLATRICIHKHINQIPDILHQPKDGARWANILGQCAGENYRATMKRSFKDSPECNDMDHWN